MSKAEDSKFFKETMKLLEGRDFNMAMKEEVERILKSGAIDMNIGCTRNILFGVALENLSDNYLRGERKYRFYNDTKKI